MRHPFMPAPGGNDGKTAGARPIDQIGGQRRLVAIGHRIDYPCFPRLDAEARTNESVGFER